MPGRSYTGASGYRYGFNGQEKDDEVSGNGNSNTAEFWQYDTRLGRRWNLDPKPNVSISGYNTFANNPIWYSDASGDTIGVNFFPVRTFAKDLLHDIHNALTGKGLIFSKVGATFVKDRCNDGYFAVFGHGSPYNMEVSQGFESKDVTVENFDKTVSSKAPEWEKAKDKVGTSITLYSCETGSHESMQADGKPPIPVKENFAQKISKAHPNILVVAPNGDVIYGIDKNGKPTILGVDNGKGTGAFITYKNGKEMPSLMKFANYDSKKENK